MKTKPILNKFIPVAAALVMLTSQQSSADVSISIGFNTFQTDLAPYGSWATVSTYGTVWRPHVAAGWRPYTDGRWVYSDQGWVWASNESFGWATYHYGRWLYQPDTGWYWVPGAVWAPSWVTWYVTPQYIGWAPLEPSGAPALSLGYSSFVPCRSFLSVNLGSVCLPSAQNVTIGRGATVINNINVVNNNTIINNGPSVAMVRKVTGQSVTPVRIVNSSSLGANGAQHNQVQGGSLYAYRPSVQAPAGSSKTPLLNNEATHGQVWLGSHNATVRPVALAPKTSSNGPAAPAKPLAPTSGSKGPAAPAKPLAPTSGSKGPAAPAKPLAPTSGSKGPAAPAKPLAPQNSHNGPAAPAKPLAPHNPSSGPLPPAPPARPLAPHNSNNGPSAPSRPPAPPHNAPAPPARPLAPQGPNNGSRPAPPAPPTHNTQPAAPHGSAPAPSGPQHADTPH